MGEVDLTLHFNHVTKSFYVPNGHLHELLDVYTTLADLDMPDVIRCRSLKVTGLCTCDFGWPLKEPRMHTISSDWSPRFELFRV